jgi:hypothetical protein
MAARPRLKLGDVVEIKTAKGFAYAQYVNRHVRPPRYGILMRILPGTFRDRPKDFHDLVAQDGSYCCFWSASYDVADGKVKVVANVEIPKQHRRMPLFKWSISGRVGKWNIRDMKYRSSKPVKRLTAEQERFPLLQLVPLWVVVFRIEVGWTPQRASYGDRGLPVVPKRPSASKAKKAPPQKITEVSLYCNDATWDTAGEIEEEGMRFVREVIADAKRLIRRGSLDREPANAVIAIAAIILAKHGYVQLELRREVRLKEVLEEIPQAINPKLLGDLVTLVEQVRTQSEVQRIWKAEGLEKEWLRKVGVLVKRLKSLT